MTEFVGKGPDREPPKDIPLPHDDLRLLVTGASAIETSLVGKSYNNNILILSEISFELPNQLVRRTDIQGAIERLSFGTDATSSRDSERSLRFAFAPDLSVASFDRDAPIAVRFAVEPKGITPRTPLEEGIHEFYKQGSEGLNALQLGSQAVAEASQSGNLDLVDDMLQLARDPEVADLMRSIHKSMQGTEGVSRAIGGRHEGPPKILGDLQQLQEHVDIRNPQDRNGIRIFAFHLLGSETLFNKGAEQGRR